ncbi:MAG: TraR/DksA C4-type zinc finger protein [Deltaproteobacteria bacterium]|nr:TraR/DksA C4-type zinc finger protein [Deltaproteobacteria bacterium]
MAEYKEIIKLLKMRRNELERRINIVEQDIRKPHPQDSEEQALERESDDVLDVLDEAARAELNQIYNALERIKRNEYEICVVCKEKIPIKRLKALPYTDRCVVCA